MTLKHEEHHSIRCEPQKHHRKPEGSVRHVVKRLRANQGQAWVISNGRKVPVRLIGATDEQELHWHSDELIERGPLRLEFSGPAIGYRAQLVSHGEHDGALRTSLPTHFEPVRVRSEPRFDAPAGVRLLVRGLWRSFPLVNLSDRGLQFSSEDDMSFLTRDESFDADATFHGALRVQLTLNVRHVSALEQAPGWGVGCTVSFASSEDEARWHEQVDEIRCSDTQVGKLFTRDMWELFDTAGYFALSSKNPGEFGRYRQAFERCSRYLSAQPEHGVQAVFPSSRGVEATASAVAEGEHTAVIYHVAKRAGDDPRGIDGKIVLRSVYERALTWASRRQVQWVSAWVQDVTRFSCGLHRDFCMAHASEGAGVFTFRALEIAAHADAPHDAEYDVATAEHELDYVLAAFRARHPDPIGEARAWNPAAFVNPSSPLGRSMPRERRVVVARKDGKLSAAAILECAQPGLHLFGIFDSCYVVSFDGDPPALGALLNEASRWYAARAKTHFVYASDDLTRQVPMARDLGITHESIFPSELMSKFLEHLWQLTAEGT